MDSKAFSGGVCWGWGGYPSVINVSLLFRSSITCLVIGQSTCLIDVYVYIYMNIYIYIDIYIYIYIYIYTYISVNMPRFYKCLFTVVKFK